MRHLCHISLRGSPGILKILIVHGLNKGIQLIAGVLEHRTDFGAVHGSRNRLAALSNHAIPVRAKLCDSLQVCGSRHEVVDDTVVIVQILQNIDTRTIGVYGELQFNLVASAVLKVFRKLLCIDLKRARGVFNQRYLRLDSVEDSTPATITQVDVGLVGQCVQETARQVRDIDGDGANKMVERRVTGTVPDGIQLSSRDDAVTELDVNTLRRSVALIVVLQAVTARDSALLGSNDVHQPNINGQRDGVTIVINIDVVRVLLRLVTLKNRLDENVTSFAARHLIIGNQNTGRSNAGIIGCQVIAILDAEVLCKRATNDIGVANQAGSASAGGGEHSACRALVHLNIDDGGRSAEALVGITHHNVFQRNLLLLGNLHRGGERTVDAMVGLLARFTRGDKPRVLVASGDQQEVVQTNAVDAQRTLISVAGTKLNAFFETLDGHAFAPISKNQGKHTLCRTLFNSNQRIDGTFAVGDCVVHNLTGSTAHR